MATTKRAKKAKGSGRGVALGALAAAAAAGAAAGYYFYASPDAKKHRKIAAAWASDMKKDVERQAKKLKNIDKAKLATVIDDAAAAYESARTVDRTELARAARELKANWRKIAGEMILTQSPKTTAKKSVKKVVKKAAQRGRGRS